jgi:hypothetical protein
VFLPQTCAFFAKNWTFFFADFATLAKCVPESRSKSTLVNQSLTTLLYSAVSSTLCTFENNSLTYLSYSAISSTLLYKAVSSRLCVFVKSSLTNLSHRAVSTSLVILFTCGLISYNTSVANAFTEFNSSSVLFVYTSMLNYVSFYVTNRSKCKNCPR